MSCDSWDCSDGREGKGRGEGRGGEGSGVGVGMRYKGPWQTQAARDAHLTRHSVSTSW